MIHKKIAVIGAGGFIGAAFVAHARNHGHSVISITREDTDLTSNDSHKILSKMIEKVDVVVVLSALTPKKNLTEIESIVRFMDNLRIAENVLKAIQGSVATQIIYISSDAVYSPNISLLTEDSATNPESYYGLAHKIREDFFLKLADQRHVCVIRPCAVYGRGDQHNAYGPNRFLRESIDYKKINLFGAGEELRSYIFINDLVSILLRCINEKIEGVYNIAAEPAVSFLALAQLIKQVVPYTVELKNLERQLPIQHKTTCAGKILKVMDGFEYTPLETALKIMYKDLISVADKKEPSNVGS